MNEERKVEIDPKTGLWRHPQPVSRDSLNNTEEMIDNFVAECERQAAKLEITVDYYIKEFILSLIGLAILAGLFWYYKFELTIRLLSIWVFIFNGVLMGFWIWKSNSKSWEKGFIGLYFILVEIIILLGGR